MIDLTACIFNAAEEMGIARSIIAKCLKKQDMTYGQVADKLINAQATIDPKSYFMASVKPKGKVTPPAAKLTEKLGGPWREIHSNARTIKFAFGSVQGIYDKIKDEVRWADD